MVVHGIGEQSSGEAVRQAAGPILEVLERYADLSECPKPKIQDAYLKPGTGTARLTIGPIYLNGPDKPPSTWLICEAHWADSFTAPSLTSKILWSFCYGYRVFERLVPGKLNSANFLTPQAHVAAVSVLLKRLVSIPSDEIGEAFLDEGYWTKAVSEWLALEGGYEKAEVNEAETVIRDSVARLSKYYSSSRYIAA